MIFNFNIFELETPTEQWVSVKGNLDIFNKDLEVEVIDLDQNVVLTGEDLAGWLRSHRAWLTEELIELSREEDIDGRLASQP